MWYNKIITNYLVLRGSVTEWIKIIAKVMAYLFVLNILISGCSHLNARFGVKNDNVIESSIEDVIESHTGLSIDLTPNDPDNDDYSLDIWIND